MSSTLLLLLSFFINLILADNQPKCAWTLFPIINNIGTDSTRATACARGQSCSAVVSKRNRTYTYNQVTVSTNINAKREYACIPDLICNVWAGSTNQCQKITTRWHEWVPTSCNADQNYNAYTADIRDTLLYRCCNTDGCNSNLQAFDYDNNCQVTAASQSHTDFINALNQCWDSVKMDFMKDLVCDADRGDIVKFVKDCTPDNSNNQPIWTKNDPNCRYRITCAPELQELLKNFGECSCKAAKDNGRSGNVIAELLSDRWEKYCPGIELSCDDSTGRLNLIRKYYVAKWSFKLAAIIDLKVQQWIDWLNTLKTNIANRLNVLETDIKIQISSSATVSTGSTTTTVAPSNRRRLLADDTSSVDVSVEANDQTTTDYWQSLFNTQDITGGYTVSSEQSTSTSAQNNIAQEGNANMFKNYYSNIIIGALLLIVILV